MNLEDKSVEILQTEKHSLWGKIEEHQQSLRNLQNNIKHCNKCFIRAPGEKEDRRREKQSKRNGQNLHQFGEIHWPKDPRISTRRINLQRITYITAKLLRDKDKTLKVARDSTYVRQYTVLVFTFLAYFTPYNGLQFHPSHQN